ncbi:MAG: DUF5615 family PIN-like protein [Chitinophagales bacterium]|nr:DUF5615 family PIN-like protein [Chitinophagales bacterium]
MNFIVDAQLPPSLSSFLKSKGHLAVHASELVSGTQTSDGFIGKISVEQKSVVITKDNDFYHTFLIKQEPQKLIMVRVGNMKKSDLIQLFKKNFDNILSAIESSRMIELTKEEIKVLY